MPDIDLLKSLSTLGHTTTGMCLTLTALEPLYSVVGIGAEECCGGDRMVYYPIAWLPPGHDPGADGCVATTARQRAFCALGHFGSKTRPQGRGEIT